MKALSYAKVLILVSLGAFLIPTYLLPNTTNNRDRPMASYNPPPANNFKAPLSSMALVAVTAATPNVQNLLASSSLSGHASGGQSNLRPIQQNALRFIIDNTYFPQSETTIAVDPNNPSHVVGGFNDGRYFFCPLIPVDCGGSSVTSVSGFTTSTDGGATVAKSGSLPSVFENGQVMISWGDPSLAPTIDGNFFYATLAITAGFPVFGNGIMIAKSNSNLFDPNVSCATPIKYPVSNPCWNVAFVNGTTLFPVLTFEDKDRIAVDRDPSSPFYGSVYVGWDHFYGQGLSTSYLARCDSDLARCTMLSGGDAPTLSGNDQFVSWTTPVVDRAGNVHVAWCNLGTAATFGPVDCKISSSSPGGGSFGPPSEILSYMGTGTDLPNDTVVLGWATEQFRTSPGIISIAADQSPKSNNLYFTTSVCTSGHYYGFPPQTIFVSEDNPGSCGESSVLLSSSSNSGATWTSPTTLSNPAVNDQPFVTVDSLTGAVYVVYYTTQFDQFNHRIDVVASASSNLGATFRQQRITSVSDEPDSDPMMYDYIVRNGFGGSFTVPQFGDYFEATSTNGMLYVLFTSNYAVEAGTYQTDPFLAVVRENGRSPQQATAI